MKLRRLLAAVFGLSLCASANIAKAQTVPKPMLYMAGDEPYSAGGKNWVRHRYGVLNSEAFPAAFFTPAPDLPPCGANPNSSRAWVDFYDAAGKRLYGFCALGSPQHLNSLWFATEEGTIPPSWIYIEITDRKTGTKYRSNLADSVL